MTAPLMLSPQAVANWLHGQGVRRLVSDSRRVQPGDAFFAWPGHRQDARAHIQTALRQGALAVLAEADGLKAWMPGHDSRVAAVQDLKRVAGMVADHFWQQPSRALKVYAVTGTNGKTSVSWWLSQAATLLGSPCGLIGTLGTGVPPLGLRSSGLTTPDALFVHEALRGFADQGLVACAMEASSIGLAEHRLAGLSIHTALFTNLTQDHLDYHGTMQAYWQAKQQLFRWPGLTCAVVHVGDAHGAELAERLAHERPDLERWTVGVDRDARLRGEWLGHTEQGGLHLRLVEAGQSAELMSPLIGEFNAQNLLVVAAALRSSGHPLADVVRTLSRMTPVPGRLQRVQQEELQAHEPLVVVDYAHTPDALEQVLRALRPVATRRHGRLWVVFGCGGNRDAGKRPRMAQAAEAGADRVVLTTDNPRDEAPRMILAQMATGLMDPDRVAVIEDRREAIRHAVARADAQDVVLLAGKGHEDYQEVAGVQHRFSDTEEALAALSARRPARADPGRPHGAAPGVAA